jgi:hypothetical protein
MSKRVSLKPTAPTNRVGAGMAGLPLPRVIRTDHALCDTCQSGQVHLGQAGLFARLAEQGSRCGRIMLPV